MVSLLVPILVAILAIAAFILGLTDRPAFNATSGNDFYAIVALSDKKDIGGNVMRLLVGTIKGIQATSDGKSLLGRAAASYGSPQGAESVSVGLYLDDPATTDHPRWAIGYAVDTATFAQAKALAASMTAVDEEPVRAVRVSLKSALKAKIPWRTSLTPMIAPVLHWSRAFATYKKGGHATPCGRHAVADGDCAYALEVYVTGPKGSRAWIDYLVVMGDTTDTLDDLYPEEKELETPPASESASAEAPASEETPMEDEGGEDAGIEETPPQDVQTTEETPPEQEEAAEVQDETPPETTEETTPEEEADGVQEEEETGKAEEETVPEQEEAPETEETPPATEEAPSDAEETATE